MPEGVYCYFQYDQNGNIQAVVRMNDALLTHCAEELPGDVNRDCTVDLLDLAIMADNWLKNAD